VNGKGPGEGLEVRCQVFFIKGYHWKKRNWRYGENRRTQTKEKEIFFEGKGEFGTEKANPPLESRGYLRTSNADEKQLWKGV